MCHSVLRYAGAYAPAYQTVICAEWHIPDVVIQFFWWWTHTYLLTHSMVQSPSWAANWFAASQEIPHISRNPKVHYRTHKRKPPISILGQPNPVHIPTSHLLERSILTLSTHLGLGLSSGLIPSGFPTKTLYTPSPQPYAPHAQPISFFSMMDTLLSETCREFK